MNRHRDTPRPFLTARWEQLLLINWACPGELLEPLAPAGTRLDPWGGETLVSLVGFMFRDTCVRGIGIPGHRTFEEVNLRFYVRRTTPAGEERRGVVFIRELVPRRAIALVARWAYGEPYLAVPMSHAVTLAPDEGGTVEYGWMHGGRRFRIAATVRGPARPAEPGSEAEFITEHYWGYTRRGGGGNSAGIARRQTGATAEYRVDHPRWDVWEAPTVSFSGAARPLYGSRLAEVLAGSPRSAFVALGSDVIVHPGGPISV